MTALVIVTFLIGGAALVLSVPCVLDEGIDYPGMDINLDTGSNEDRKESFFECGNLCNEYPECNFFTWKSQSNECWLKTGIGTKRQEVGSTSGSACRETTATVTDCNNPEILADTYHQGNDLRWYGGIKDAKACLKNCKDYMANHGTFCEGMTYLASYKWCYLHSKVEDDKIKKRSWSKPFFARNEMCPSKFPFCYPEIRYDISHKGNDLLSKTFESVEECYQYCKDLEVVGGKFCAGITFKEKDKRCWLHSKVEECKLSKSLGHLFAKNAPCEKETVNSYEKIECGDLSCLDPGHTLRKWSGPSKECAAKTKFREFTQAGKDKLVKLHNEYRQKIAAGKETEGNLEGVESSNMRKVIWNDELAMTAQRWTDQCTFGHDKNRGMCDGTYAGQNGAGNGAGWDEANDYDYAGTWYSEVTRFNASDGDIELLKFKKETYLHFSQVVWADSYMIGCGITSYMKKPDDSGMFNNVVCNYGPGGNWVGSRLYKVGEKCSECPEGTTCDTTYDALCALSGFESH